MDNPAFALLSRQVGLESLMRVTANNIANVSTTGFKREGGVFAEWIDRLAVDGGALSQTRAHIRTTDYSQGALRVTGGDLDVAIEGEGYFAIATPDGPRLTRNGAFTRAGDGALTTAGGARVLDAGGAAIALGQAAGPISIAADGVISIDGNPVAQLGVSTVADRNLLIRGADGQFAFDGELTPVDGATVIQGHLEQSNVDPVRELTRMIDIQRNYEAAQNLLRAEDERLKQAVRVMGGAS